MDPVRRLYVVTHRDPAVVGGAVDELVAAARACGVQLVAAPEEAARHPSLAAAVSVEPRGDRGACDSCEAAIVLAGDGTLLRVASSFGGRIPALGVNFGMLGYLSGAGHDSVGDAVRWLAEGRCDLVRLPMLGVGLPGADPVHAVNDVVASGGVTGRVIEVAWRIVSTRQDGSERIDEMGAVPCDGMVVATPVGSTAYNLSNGGPVLAWGVDGMVVSFIAPHTLAARPLVVAPGDAVELEHLGRGADLQVFADGSKVHTLAAGDRLRIEHGPRAALLAFIDGASFYGRYRDNFAPQLQFSGPRRGAPREEAS